MQISVVGLGFVGLTLAVVSAKKNFKTIGIDIDRKKIEEISKCSIRFYEPDLEKLLKNTIKKRQLEVTADFKKINNTDITFITVGTPSKENGQIDLSYLTNAINSVHKTLKNKKKTHTVVIKSTVTPTTLEKIIAPKFKNLKNIILLSNPEFLREGNAVHDLLNPHLIVIGEKEKNSSYQLKNYYKKFYMKKTDTIVTSYNTAELIKYANNTFLATKLSFINSFANICESIPNADIKIISEAIGKDVRIGKQFLSAGPGFGGSCLPKDLSALIDFSKKYKLENSIFQTVKKINDEQPNQIFQIIKKNFESIDKRISLLGLAFKSGTDDIRESVSMKLIKLLIKNNFIVNVHDPLAIMNTKKIFGDKIFYHESIKKCLEKTNCCAILTDSIEYKKLSQAIFEKNMNYPLVIDTRRIFERDNFKKIKLISFGMNIDKTNY